MAGLILENSSAAPQEHSAEVTTSRVEPNLDNPASFFLEYLNNIDQEYNMSQQLGNDPGFGYSNVQNPTAYIYTGEQDYGINLLQTGNFHETYERLDTPIGTQNGNMSTSAGVRNVLNQINNRDGDSADEWSVVETPPEESP
ncbi:hypothetical protein PC116_g28546 [Phytophthora cactorum]|nr:hypothetical protein PC116_g28546 [Phytophthora cactorum]